MNSMKFTRIECTCEHFYVNRDSYELNASKYRTYSSEGYSITDKQWLISSILNGYDIGPIYIYNKHSTNKSAPDTNYIVGGNEQIEAILQFMDDKFPIYDIETEAFMFDTPAGRWYYEYNGKRFSELKEFDPELVERFKNHMINVTYIETNDENRLRDMLKRLVV